MTIQREKYEEKVERERVISVTCDMCGEVYAGSNGDFTQGVAWPAGSFRAIETCIKHVDLATYPEDVYGTESEVHICPTCFTEKLRPWLESQGVTFTDKKVG